MSNCIANVFSKHARFQVMGPIPPKAGDLQGWPIINGFLSIVNFHVGNYVQFWCQRFLETGEVS